MKRSIVLSQIAKIIKDYEDNISTEFAAEEILSSLEKAGMLPPPFSKIVDEVNDVGIHYIVSYNLHEDEDLGHVSDWDKE